MRNVDLFEDYAAQILARLFDQFPVKVALDARELCGDRGTDDFGGVIDEQGRPSRRFDIAMATIEWLADNGHIRIGDRGAFGFQGAVLTAAGLQVLKKPAGAITGTESVGARIVRFVREGSLAMAREAVKAATGAGVEGLAG